MSKSLALTLGEPAGIGPDLTLAIWQQRSQLSLPPFYVLGDAQFLARRAKLLGLDVPVATIAASKAAETFPTALPVVSIDRAITAEPGRPDASSAPAAIEAIRRAVADVLRGAAAAIVTNPIAKNVLYQSGFAGAGAHRISGQAGRRNDRAGGAACDAVVVARSGGGSCHHPPAAEGCARRANNRSAGPTPAASWRAILKRRFGIARPRIAVAGLNPHAGEEGAMGSEDAAVVRPAVQQLQAEGIDARGPLPADSMFHPAARAQLRRCLVHVSRSGADPDQDAGIRSCRQRHAWPAFRAHLARSRHRLRHRRHRPRQPVQPDRRS